jgi:glutathione S-transferase
MCDAAEVVYMTFTLYRLEGCPFCEFVVDELDDLGLEFDSVWVEGLHSKRDEVKRVSGQRQVPVLVDDEFGLTIHQSARIIEYLRTTHGEEEVEPGTVEPSF